VGDIRINIIA